MTITHAVTKCLLYPTLDEDEVIKGVKVQENYWLVNTRNSETSLA